MGLQIYTKQVPNKNVLIFKSELPFFSSLSSPYVTLDAPLESSHKGIKGSDWEKVKRLLALPGIVGALVEDVKVSLEKAPLFDWAMLEPLVKRILRGEEGIAIPSSQNQVSYRRGPEPKSVEFLTTFLISLCHIEDIYPSQGHLQRQEKEDSIGKLGMDILRATAEFIEVRRIDHFYISPYQIYIAVKKDVLLDSECEKICFVIAKTIKIDDCKFSQLPKEPIQQYIRGSWPGRDYLDYLD